MSSKKKKKNIIEKIALELDPEKWANFRVSVQEEKTVSVDVDRCQGEKAQAVGCQVVWHVGTYTDSSGR